MKHLKNIFKIYGVDILEAIESETSAKFIVA